MQLHLDAIATKVTAGDVRVALAQNGLISLPRCRISFALSVVLRLAQTNPETTAVLIDEFNSGGLNCFSDFFCRVSPAPQLAICGLQPSDGGLRYARPPCQIGLRPPKQSARCLNLTYRNQVSAPPSDRISIDLPANSV